MKAAKVLRLVYLMSGLAILIWVAAVTDLEEARDLVTKIGVSGFAMILGLYAIAFLLDSISWLLTIESASLTARWTARAFFARLAGEAYNMLLPAAGMGGEPLKVEILHRRWGVGLKEGGVSLVLAKTVNMIALIAFLVGGFALMVEHPGFSPVWRSFAMAGLVAFVVATALFFSMQRFRLASRIGDYLSRYPWGARLRPALHHIEEVDDRFVLFYAHRRRAAGAIGLALINWGLGIVEIYLAFTLLGHPVSWTEAWIVEAVTQLIRTAAFFVPAAIGVQEGAFLLVCGAITGEPSFGVAISVIRRAREIVWAGFGVIVAWGFAGAVEPYTKISKDN